MSLIGKMCAKMHHSKQQVRATFRVLGLLVFLTVGACASFEDGATRLKPAMDQHNLEIDTEAGTVSHISRF